MEIRSVTLQRASRDARYGVQFSPYEGISDGVLICGVTPGGPGHGVVAVRERVSDMAHMGDRQSVLCEIRLAACSIVYLFHWRFFWVKIRILNCEIRVINIIYPICFTRVLGVPWTETVTVKCWVCGCMCCACKMYRWRYGYVIYFVWNSNTGGGHQRIILCGYDVRRCRESHAKSCRRHVVNPEVCFCHA